MVSFKSKLLSLSCICAVFILVGATNMFAATTVDLGGPYIGVVDTPIAFTGTASCGDGEGNIVTGTWIPGDGTATSWIVAVGTNTVTVMTTSHTYEAPGIYDVTWSVGCATGPNGDITYGTDTTTATIEADVCTPTLECPGYAECGSMPDGCGVLLDCGGDSCAAGESCIDFICQSGCIYPCWGGLNYETCGMVTVPDQCDGPADCGSCDVAGEICVDNICVPDCDPITECPAEFECGDIPDSCYGTINCGECDPTNSCVDNICEPDCECDDDWKNHGQYVRCVAWTAEDLVDLGSITEDEKDEIVAEAAESDCGKK